MQLVVCEICGVCFCKGSRLVAVISPVLSYQLGSLVFNNTLTILQFLLLCVVGEFDKPGIELFSIQYSIFSFFLTFSCDIFINMWTNVRENMQCALLA